MSRYIQPPPLQNVRNIKPRSRNRSHTNGASADNMNSRFVNKDVIEKKRLKERAFGHVRYNPDIIDDPINPIPNNTQSLSYSNDIERFNRDIIEYNTQQKNDKISRHNLKIQHLTKERIDRDKQRWNSMNLQYETDENKIKRFNPVKNNPSMPYNPIPNNTQSLSYSNDIERFNRDIIEYNTQQKNDKISRHNLKIQHLTKERIDRDKQRWNSMNLQYETDENKIKRFNPVKNNPSMPYNPITLRYDDSLDGKRLEYQDKQSIYRAKLREKRLFEKQTCGYDPVTGKPKMYTNNIVKPAIPNELTK
eukprot:1074372_1